MKKAKWKKITFLTLIGGICFILIFCSPSNDWEYSGAVSAEIVRIRGGNPHRPVGLLFAELENGQEVMVGIAPHTFFKAGEMVILDKYILKDAIKYKFKLHCEKAEHEKCLR